MTGAIAKITAMAPSDSAMPTEPTSNSGLRPTLSTSRIATMVTVTLMVAEIREKTKDWDSEKPADCHRVLE